MKAFVMRFSEFFKLIAFPFEYIQDRFKVPFSLHFHGKVNIRIEHQQAKQLRAPG